MRIKAISENLFNAELSDEELSILMGCMNEALELKDFYFHARLGVEKSEVEELFDTMSIARRSSR